MRRSAAAVLAALATACAAPASAQKKSQPGEPHVFQGSVGAGALGAFETGRLAKDQAIAGPFVLTSLGVGDEVVIVPADGRSPAIGSVIGPIPAPFEIPAGVKLVASSLPDGALYSGYRPMPITRALEAYLNRTVQLQAPGGQPEPWTLRQIGSDHVIVERNRTYRALPLRRLAEITWTDLSGIDPTPKLVISAD
jgi:hypothetical protein